MQYATLEQCLIDLERNGELIRIKEQVDPYLEMAAIHLRIHQAGGPAILFENIKGSKFRAASNIFGTLNRSKFIFKNTLPLIQQILDFKNNPLKAIKNPIKSFKVACAALNAIPLKNPISKQILFQEIKIEDLPQIHHWQDDGGAFITLPQVYSEDLDNKGIMNANLGMYRIQLSGNEYDLNEEIGLHYQLHRGIGIHQTKANKKNLPLKVSIFIGGPPSHTVAAVMPLPEGISEMTFAGVLGGRRVRYFYKDGYCMSADADFVITGDIYPNSNKPEGPFGDHLGYYSLQHPFPVLKVYKVFAKKNAIWPFTVVGRPPQEDTSFGQLIHEISGKVLQQEIPGLKEVNAVDAAGVHPLLLAIGSERYTPYLLNKKPAEILTIANHILGTGQLSLAKFLFITADDDDKLNTKDIKSYFNFLLKKIDLTRDIHFYTNTTLDTLDYSGTAINNGSKVVLAAYGKAIRELTSVIPNCFFNLNLFTNAKIILPGIIALQTKKFTNYLAAKNEMEELNEQLKFVIDQLTAVPLLIICDDCNFIETHINNFLWNTFTKCNPSHDIYGIDSFVNFKHWGCNGPLIFDARSKPHHAPPLIKNAAIELKVDNLFEKMKLKF